MILSDRLQAVTELLPKGNIVADVGCDHGYISISLVESNRFNKAIALDVRKGPLSIAKDNIGKNGFDDRIMTRLSDGLAGVELREADAAILAGMGGLLVIGILERSLEKAKAMNYLVLQPQSDIHLVRAFLRENNFIILKENMIKEDGKYYPMFLVSYSLNELEAREKLDRETDIEIDVHLYAKNLLDESDYADTDKASQSKIVQDVYDYYGKDLIYNKNAVLIEYLLHEKEVNNTIISKIPSTNVQRLTEIDNKLKMIDLTLNMMRV